MNIEARHRELIAAVNNSKTQAEWNKADATLRGWRMGVSNASGDAYEYGWMNVMDWHDADLHHKGKDSERPMCLGVFLDWKPSDTAITSQGES